MTTTSPHTIRTEIFFPHPVPRVWAALTDPAALAKWFMPNDFRAEVGHEFTFRTQPRPPHFDGIARCSVVEVDPPHRLAYTFGPPGVVVRYVLTAQERNGISGTLLQLAHGEFDLDDPSHRAAHGSMAPGWTGSVLPRLGAMLDDLRNELPVEQHR